MLDRKRLGVVRENQPQDEGRALWDCAGTFNRAAEDREVRHSPFTNDGRIREHHRILSGERNTVVMALIGLWGFHGGLV